MAATDDSLSLDRLASFSFDDILSADNVDGESDSRDLESLSEVKDQYTLSEPVCNGIMKGETDPAYTRPHATIADPSAGKDSPPVAVVSPSRLVDAKRRFFCEPPQPVWIDPRRVFDEIPAASAKAASTPHGSSTRLTSNNASSRPVNGLNSEAPAAVEGMSSFSLSFIQCSHASVESPGS